MPAFQYEAVTTTGQRNSGEVEAADRAEAIRKLSRRGLQPSVVREAGGVEENKGSKSKAPVEKSAEKTGVPTSEGIVLKRGEVIQFTEELTDLLSAGLQLEQALHAMENRSSTVLKTLSQRLREKVRDGVPFSVALQSVSPSFGELYANLVAAGEASGSLTSILNRQAKYLNAMEALRSKVTAALIYPAFIVVSGIALGIVFITYLLPKLIILIKNTGGKMPGIATVLLSLSNFIKTWWWGILILLVLMVVAGKVYLADPDRRKNWHRIILGLPLYGPLLRTRFEVQFLETLSNLLVNGLPLHRALELVRKTTMNLYLRESLATVETQVADGSSLSRVLEKTGVTRPLVVDMIRVGEQTGEMAEALGKAAERFDRQLTKVMERATAALQPVIILCMAGMVGTMAWMMISVVYSTLENLRRH
ncbi:MAG: type II secretion system F family protein [Verrucomicrobiaceae bacterium]